VALGVTLCIVRDAKGKEILFLNSPLWLWCLIGLSLNVMGLALYWAVHYWAPIRDSWKKE